MKLQTQIPLQKSVNQIAYKSHLLILGSCFSEHIGAKFEHFKFQSLQNPFGILFHPKAIENLIERSVSSTLYSEKEVFFQNERWHCFDAHSVLSDTSKDALLLKLNKGLEASKKRIKEASHIIITLGTAWVYRKVENERIVSNCHKIPQSEFKKELLSVYEVINCLKNCIQQIRKINKNVAIVFTVSPVRHLKDGFVENQKSKAHLIAAIHEIIEQDSALYFPSYEIMMDELRDYRFYETDMVHPNQLAVDYIWLKFKKAWISNTAFSSMEKVEEVQKGLQHRPFNEQSEQHQKFIKTLEKKITYLQQEYPFMKF
ncbi:GSCFA domain-containing protein [Aurantibacter crassamenti]|uniref:GSCFA domain-containing protein n=1 Tax=Aurantibacter crassamenti TaxID=1837375 RepID=UPI001939D54E|nr:GSCFA domain-containing protein [Aurantibacter crassamenti]MBM1105906.1 GSCFA domain-containing protein [Aurantibacter crassamenti]